MMGGEPAFRAARFILGTFAFAFAFAFDAGHTRGRGGDGPRIEAVDFTILLFQ